MSRKSEIIAAVDIGTTKVVAFVGRYDIEGRIELLGKGEVASKGVKRGMIQNQAEVIQTISEAMNYATARLEGETVKKVFVGINGQHIHTKKTTVSKRIDEERTISHDDINDLKEIAARLELTDGEMVYDLFPQEYQVDQDDEIINPVGIQGERIRATFNVIVGSESYKRNIEACMNRAGWPVHKWFVTPLAETEMMLSEDEKEAGVVLVNVGGGSSSVSVYYDGLLRHMAIIPFGGEVVTRDIKEGCSILLRHAETLKIQHGAAIAEAVPDNHVISIPGLDGWPAREVLRKNVACIVEARMDEIFDSICYQIEKSNYLDQLGVGVILSGGCSNMEGVLQLLSYKTGLYVRQGTPNKRFVGKTSRSIEGASHGGVLGILRLGLKMASPDHEKANSISRSAKSKTTKEPEERNRNSKFLDSVKHRFLSLFEEDDTELIK